MPESPGSNPQDAQTRPPRGIMPPVLVDLLVPAAKVGALTGGMGAIGGAAAGILKESHPVVYGLAYSIQCFALGSTFWLSRSVAVQGWGGEHNLTPRDRLKVSSIGGAVAGTVNGLTRGPRHIIPSTIIWTVFGVAGQGVVNKVNGWKGQKTGSEETSWLSSKWSPLRKLSDQEYEDFMSEKMLKVEAEIALIDDKIAELREEERVKQGGKAQAVPQEAEKPQKSSWWRWS